MKKIFNLVISIVMAVMVISVMTACNNTKEVGSADVVTGPKYTVKTDKDGNEYAILEKYSISDEDAKKIADGDYEDLMVDLEVNFYNDTIPVKEILSGAFSNQLALRSLVIGENVETIGSACLAGCVNLKELTIPFVGGVKTDAKNAQKTLGYLFGSSEVEGATSVTVSYNASSSATYYIPNSLEKVTLTGDEITDYAFYGMTVRQVVLSGNLKNIGCYSFASMPRLNKITIPSTVTEIKKNAFSNSTGLYTVEFSSDSALTTIWQEAFSGCTNLGMGAGSVKLPNTVSKIYYSAFKNCSKLIEMDLSNTQITSVPDTCFYGCDKLGSLVINDGVTLGSYAVPNDTQVACVVSESLVG